MIHWQAGKKIICPGSKEGNRQLLFFRFINKEMTHIVLHFLFSVKKNLEFDG
jgi:hypothetical protein